MRKVAPPKEKSVAERMGVNKAKEESAEEKKAREDGEKNDLIIELLGYMEAPNGNLEELTDKAKNSTHVSRGFIYTLLRRGWLDGYRITDELPSNGDKAQLQVFPGKEWTSAMKVKDITETQLNDRFRDPRITVARVHMYRFDDKAKVHVLDKLTLVKGHNYPIKPPPFNELEPRQDSLENRRKWEEWNFRKQEYLQSDYPQFELIFNKLKDQDVTTVAVYNQLQNTMVAMRRMADSLRDTFKEFSAAELKEIVQSIPNHIKSVTKQLQQQRGIIIRGEGLKLTPEFLRALDLKPKAVIAAEEALKKAAQAEAEARAKESKAEKADPTLGAPVISLKNLPLDEVLKVLEKSAEETKQEVVEQVTLQPKLRRLATFHHGHRRRPTD
jgi:chemotaxis protein histidine kinase CheA